METKQIFIIENSPFVQVVVRLKKFIMRYLG